MNIVPYVKMRNEYSISDFGMVNIYRKMQKLDLVKIVFSGGEVQTEERFLRFAKNSRNVVHVVTEDDVCVQISWLNRWGHNHAFCHTCMFPEIWGKRTLWAGRLSLKYWFGFEIDGRPLLDVIMSKTSLKNEYINRYLERMGFHHLGVVPGINKDFYNNTNQDAVFKYIRREDVLWKEYTPES